MYTKKIKTGKLTPLFISYKNDYKISKELDLIEFTVQVISYSCTVSSIVWGVISPILYILDFENLILICFNFMIGLLFLILSAIIQTIYFLLVDFIFPKFLEIPMSKIKDTEVKIESFRKELCNSIKSQKIQTIME